MSNRLTPRQKTIILTSLSSGDSQTVAARKAKTTCQTVNQNKPLIDKAEIIKKEVAERVKNEIIEDQVKFVKDFNRIIQQGLDAITPASLAKQSASANAMVIGTIFDKKQLETGGMTDIVEVRDSQALSDKLKLKLSKSKSAKIPEKPDNKSIGFGAKIKID